MNRILNVRKIMFRQFSLEGERSSNLCVYNLELNTSCYGKQYNFIIFTKKCYHVNVNACKTSFISEIKNSVDVQILLYLDICSTPLLKSHQNECNNVAKCDLERLLYENYDTFTLVNCFFLRKLRT